MRLRHAAPPALALLLPLASAAAEPRYTYLEAGYEHLEIDGRGLDVDGGGFNLGGSLRLADQVFLQAEYSLVDLDFGIDAQQFSAAIGGYLPLRSDLHLVGTVGFASAELDTRAGDVDDDGLLASGGVRWMAREALELTAKLTYSDFDDAGDDVSLTIGGLYNLTPDLAFDLGATFGDDVTRYTAGLRYYIPNRR